MYKQCDINDPQNSMSESNMGSRGLNCVIVAVGGCIASRKCGLTKGDVDMLDLAAVGIINQFPPRLGPVLVTLQCGCNNYVF